MAMPSARVTGLLPSGKMMVTGLPKDRHAICAQGGKAVAISAAARLISARAGAGARAVRAA
jgi:hypothetical protein